MFDFQNKLNIIKTLLFNGTLQTILGFIFLCITIFANEIPINFRIIFGVLAGLSLGNGITCIHHSFNEIET